MTKLTAFLLGLLSLAAGGSSAREDPPAYSQKYTIVINGSPAGTESVSERVVKDGLISESTHDIFVSDGADIKRLSFTTSMKLEKGTYAPLQYSCRYTSGESKDSYEVIVRKGVVSRTLTRGGHSSEASAPLKPGMVIVDINVFHHFDYLLKRYDFKKAGRQSFTNFLPIIASDISIALTRLEDSDITGGQITIPVQNYKVELVGIWLGVASFDSGGRLVRLLIQDKGLEVIRKDLQPE